MKGGVKLTAAAAASALCLSAAWPVLAPAPAEASVALALTLEQLAERADVIVVATATEEQSRRHIDGKLIVTDVSLKVDTVLKGDAKPNATLVATVLGGHIDQLAMQVPGEASFEIGRRVIAFLQRAKHSGDLRVVGMAQGVLPLIQRDTTTMVLPASGDNALMERDENGRLREGQGALQQPVPVGELLERIRAIVAKQTK
jgi:hypothetical protein